MKQWRQWMFDYKTVCSKELSLQICKKNYIFQLLYFSIMSIRANDVLFLIKHKFLLNLILKFKSYV
jgi:hypothetical protein